MWDMAGFAHSIVVILSHSSAEIFSSAVVVSADVQLRFSYELSSGEWSATQEH